MKKISLIIASLLIFSGICLAQENLYFMPQHWVLGSIEGSADLLPLAQGKKVLLYKPSSPESFAEDLIGVNGNSNTENQFAINTFRIPTSTPWQAGETLILKIESFQGPLGENGPSYTAIAEIPSSKNSGVEYINLVLTKESESLSAFSVSPNKIDFSAEQYSPISPKNISISNIGNASIFYSISKNQAWLGFSSTEGIVAPGKTSTISVEVSQDADWLAVGKFSDLADISDLNGLAATKTISINLEITPATTYVTPEIKALTIAKQGKDIKVSWQKKPADLDVELYISPGPPSIGSWKKPEDLSGFELHLNENYFLHKNQVGEGTKETYYTIVPKGSDPDKAAAAPAVGKFNFTCKKGFNPIAFSLKPVEGQESLDAFIGSQLTSGTPLEPGDEIYAYDGGANKAILINNQWTTAKGDITVKPGCGYWIKRVKPEEPEDKIVTITGKIIKEPFEKDLPAGFNFIGNPYSLTFLNLQAAGFDPAVTGGITDGSALAPGDEIYFFVIDVNGKITMQKTSVINKTWNNACKFDPYIAYWYKVKGNSIQWQIKP